MRRNRLLAAVETLELHKLLARIAATTDAGPALPGRSIASAGRTRQHPCSTIELLEGRRMLAYSAVLAGNVSTWGGDSSGGTGDILTFAQSGGLLVHNRFAAGDAGFNSAFDFNSTDAGDQTLPASAASTVNVRTGGSSLDQVRIGGTVGTATAAASELLATFSVNNNGVDGQTVLVNDGTSSTPNILDVSDSAVIGTGINVRYSGFAAFGSIDVLGGSGADTFNVTSSTKDLYSLNGGDPASNPGDVLNFDTQFIDGTDSGTQITQAGRQPVNYQNIESVNVFNEIADSSQLVVTNTNNSGLNSLRNAITLANFLPGLNTIKFNIPGTGVQTIAPTSTLPTITDPVVIDGYTQPGASANTLIAGDNAVLKIVLNGAVAGAGASGLTITAGMSTVQGLAITGFIFDSTESNAIAKDGHGIVLFINGGNVIRGNFIGTEDGTSPSPNTNFGIVIRESANNIIGGTTAAAPNIISGNAGTGLRIVGSTATNNHIQGNFIGTDATGTSALGNGGGGVAISNASHNNTIGGTTAGTRNIISGNGFEGVGIFNPGSTGNLVAGNFIGTDVTGTAALGNAASGVSISSASNNTIGGPTAAHRNVIAGHSEYGIEIGFSADNNRILGNYIGTDITGSVSLPNNVGIGLTDEAAGIEIGGPAPGEGNVISASSKGISVEVGECLIRGNFIGTNATGTAALGNGAFGIMQVGGKVTIGGANAGDRNVISGWSFGILLDATDDTSTAAVYGNFIGTDVTGTSDLGNGTGILVVHSIGSIIGGAAPGEGNLISGNDVSGIGTSRFSSSVGIYGNRIGTDVTGKLPLGNTEDGIQINGNFNYVGGKGAGQGNVIAFNGAKGVNIRSAAGSSARPNFIYSNSIFSNTLLGIDLNNDGVTPNDPGDADIGPNGLANTPTVTRAFTNGTGVAVVGKLEALPFYSGYTIQIFASPGPDASGFGEGKLLLGTFDVNADATGLATFAAEFPFAIPAGQVITATATGPDGTSEFSEAVTVTGNPPRVSINDVTVTEGNGVPVSATFTISLSDAVSGPVSVDFTTADGTAVAPGDYLSQAGTITFNPGETTRTVTVTVNPDSLAEGTETFVVNLSNSQIADIADGQGVGTIRNTVVPPPPPPPVGGFSINDRSINEGNSGTKQLVFTVTRGGNTSGTASVKFKTVNQTADGTDYNAATGTLTFAAGQTTKTISITIKGDTKKELNETFRVELYSAVGATIADNKGIGTINNDDGPINPPLPNITPKVFIGDASIYEGDSGTRTLTFAVTLEKATSKTVSLNFATQNYTAGEGDYQVKSGTITFAPGETSKLIQIIIKGDTKVEGNEQFKINLSNLVNAILGDGQAIGTIKNDD